MYFVSHQTELSCHAVHHWQNDDWYKLVIMGRGPAWPVHFWAWPGLARWIGSISRPGPARARGPPGPCTRLNACGDLFQCCYSKCCHNAHFQFNWYSTSDYEPRNISPCRTNQLQTQYAHVPMPAQQSSSVPDGPLHISIRRCLSSAATFCQ